MGGDEEEDAGIDKYDRYTDAKDSRLFHVGTASGSYVKNRNASLTRMVIVTEATGIKDNRQQTTDNGQGTRDNRHSFDLQGHPATKQSKLIIKDGKKILKR